LALTSPTSSGRSVGIVRWRTKAPEFSFFLAFKKGGKLKKDERWTVNDKKLEVTAEINYLGVTFESSGGSKRQKLKPIAKGN
jgi:hypothetical protein